MLEILQNQRAEVLKELAKLYEQRRNAGVESLGGIKNRIANLKEELERLDAEIAEFSTRKIPSNSPKKEETPGAIKAKIRALVGEGELGEAIELIQKNWDKTDLILLSARFNKLKKGANNGTISQSDYRVEFARITHSLLETLKKL